MPPAVLEVVHDTVEQKLARLRQSSQEQLLKLPAVADLLAGKPAPNLYVNYLLNVFHYASHSATVIGTAGARCVSRSPRIGEYLLRHATEEIGHEAWALSDLQSLGIERDAVLRTKPSPSCMAMIGMEYYWATQGNPEGLLGWMFTLEAFGDDIGHLMASKVATNAGADESSTRFLRGHGDADHTHIKEITDVIVKHVHGETLDDVLYVAELACGFYLGLISESAAPNDVPNR